MSGNEDAPSRVRYRSTRAGHSSQSEGEGSSEEGCGRLVSDLSRLEVGTKLEAMDKYGKWYVARVVELVESEGEVLVHFERWSSRYDELIAVKSGRLRFLTEAKLRQLELERERAKKVSGCQLDAVHIGHFPLRRLRALTELYVLKWSHPLEV